MVEMASFMYTSIITIRKTTDSNPKIPFMSFWKKQSYRDNREQISGCQGMGWQGGGQVNYKVSA